MRSQDETQALLGRLRDELYGHVEAHDREAHGGRRCQRERVNVVAYLMHCLGVGRADLPQLLVDLDEYDLHCRDAKCPQFMRGRTPGVG